MAMFGRRLPSRVASTILIVLTTGLGVGGVTAAYATLDTFFLRPVPGVVDERDLVTIRFRPEGSTASAFGSSDGLEALRQAGRVAQLETLGWGCCHSAVALTISGASVSSVTANFVSSEYFATLGVRAVAGRLISDEEADRGEANAAVISERLWRVHFRRSDTAIGSTLFVNRQPFIVVGVADRFQGWGDTRVGDIDLWLPNAARQAVTGGDAAMSVLVGRYPRNRPTADLQRALQIAYADAPLEPRYLAFKPFVERGLWPLNQSSPEALRVLLLVMGAAVALLGLACANVSNLLFVRFMSRAQDTAIRLALGATRWQVRRLFFRDVLWLGGLGAVAGFVAAQVMLLPFRSTSIRTDFPDISHVSMDVSVLLACIATAFVTIAVSGVITALAFSRDNAAHVLSRQGTGRPRQLRVLTTQVGVQICLSLILSCAALAATRSIDRLMRTELGINVEAVMSLTLRPRDAGYSTIESSSRMESAAQALRDAGFSYVAVAFPGPLSGWSARIDVWRETAPTESISVRELSISPNYFDTVGTRLSPAGRSRLLSTGKRTASIRCRSF